MKRKTLYLKSMKWNEIVKTKWDGVCDGITVIIPIPP